METLANDCKEIIDFQYVEVSCKNKGIEMPTLAGFFWNMSKPYPVGKPTIAIHTQLTGGVKMKRVVVWLNWNIYDTQSEFPAQDRDHRDYEKGDRESTETTTGIEITGMALSGDKWGLSSYCLKC